jgi:hypothetical protein
VQAAVKLKDLQCAGVGGMVNSLGLGKLLGGSSGGNKLMVRFVSACFPLSCFLSILHLVGV